MSEQENTSATEPQDEDVEAHKRKAVQATDEPKAEGEADDDVELHRRRSS